MGKKTEPAKYIVIAIAAVALIVLVLLGHYLYINITTGCRMASICEDLMTYSTKGEMCSKDDVVEVARQHDLVFESPRTRNGTAIEAYRGDDIQLYSERAPLWICKVTLNDSGYVYSSQFIFDVYIPWFLYN